jgi:hypothetical protein
MAASASTVVAGRSHHAAHAAKINALVDGHARQPRRLVAIALDELHARRHGCQGYSKH